ncbi:MAG TPA: GNAT family N-acetyltransferase [Actinomycetota bacterium]|nr:GNAT family N-acetyltransferase [Actinomycetota bacterium]
MILQTERLILEPWSVDRIEDLVRLSSDPAVMRFIGSGDPWERERADHMHSDLLNHWSEHGFGWRTIRQADESEVIGVLGLSYTGPEAVEIPTPEVEIGWWLDPEVWGRGLATEAAARVRNDAFERLRLDKVIARHQVANPTSGRIMEKIGMTFEREAVGRHGDHVRIWAIGRDDWLRLGR